jgi:hypothetical protein
MFIMKIMALYAKRPGAIGLFNAPKKAMAKK